MSVFGFKENKCKSEVYCKEDYATIKYEFPVLQGYKLVEVDLPQGFSSGSTIIVGGNGHLEDTDLYIEFGLVPITGDESKVSAAILPLNKLALIKYTAMVEAVEIKVHLKKI